MDIYTSTRLLCGILLVSTLWTHTLHAGEKEIPPRGKPLVTTTGIVFNDQNGNGKKDNGENGLSKICVSDG